MASLRDSRGHGVGWAQGRHASRWEGDIAIPNVAAAAGIEADPDDDQGADKQAAHNRHLRQVSSDIEQFKLERRELAKSRSGTGRVSTATKLSKPEHKASKRVLVKAEDGREVNGEPEAKKVKPDENAHTLTTTMSNSKESSSAPASVGISALGGYSSSESSQHEDSASSSEG